MSIVGLLALRISGPVEVTPKGLKGTIESIPADALFIARDAADRALPDQGEGFSRARSILADGAAFQALENFSLIQASAQVMDLDELMRRILLYSAANTKDEVPYVVRLLQENPKVDLDESSKELISRILELAQNSDIPKATSRPAEPAEPIDISEVDVSVDVGEHEPPDE